MSQLITGIHHVTAIAGKSQKNIDFYAGILGLRLVKKTVNFDAPEVYHFYYGDEQGSPGSILTFFPYGHIQSGRHGKGMLNTTSFSVPYNSIGYWQERLTKYDIKQKPVQERLKTEAFIYFEDHDGLGLELIFTDKDSRPGFSYGHIPEEHAIKGFYNVEIWEEGYERTAALLTEQMDHTLIAEEGNRFRFAANDKPGNYVDILCMPDRLRGLGGNGTVHHIAFATPNAETQLEARQKISARMLNPTPVLDRQYFTSIYFREPGGVLFEIATSGPGFAVDEEPAHLGEALKLPPQYEPMRKEIENVVDPVSFLADNYK
ncbi:ring-cleaving dioxygenase [Danxiaibacter flavus]|uniref:Ring-cleaving dioxygenase n=1 Tax=Danxiaibacter flavus TaxID=3049108 RepID=A0ABV3Z9A0_9BACT|nr:ring-cleaving dioxygenase [Chitinophagaceae bacterium DXS]